MKVYLCKALNAKGQNRCFESICTDLSPTWLRYEGRNADEVTFTIRDYAEDHVGILRVYLKETHIMHMAFIPSADVQDIEIVPCSQPVKAVLGDCAWCGKPFLSAEHLHLECCCDYCEDKYLWGGTDECHEHQ